MTEDNRPSRFRRLKDRGPVVTLLLVVGIVFELVGIVRIWISGNSALLAIGAGLIVIGIALGQRRLTQGPSKPR